MKKVHKRFIMYQLFRATNYLHSGNVIHRDQKPSNVLLDCECNCKIAGNTSIVNCGLLSKFAHKRGRIEFSTIFSQND